MNLPFKPIFRGLLAVFACVFAGCDPEDLITWSPDGQHAILYCSDTARLIDSQGKILGEAPDARAWMPDSLRVIAVRSVKAQSWDEVAGLLGQSRALAVVNAARDLADAIRNYQGDWDKFHESDAMKLWDESHPQVAGAYSSGPSGAGSWELPAYYLKEKQPETFAELLRLFKNGEAAKDEELELKISELLIRNTAPGESANEQLLLRSVDAISWIEASPDGRLIAYVVDQPVRPALYVIPTGGGAQSEVDTGAMRASWSRDGHALVYAKTTLSYVTLQNEVALGAITRRNVADAQGEVLTQIGDPEDLAGILFGKGANRVACLPDGRILFAGTAVQLPATVKEAAGNLRLYTLTTGEVPSVQPLLSESAAAQLPERPDLFVVSPDGKFVAVPGNNGEIAVVSLENGAVSAIQGQVAEFRNSDKLANSPTPTIPAWRTGHELTYVAPWGASFTSARRGEVVLHPIGGTPRVISKEWSDEVGGRFLPIPK